MDSKDRNFKKAFQLVEAGKGRSILSEEEYSTLDGARLGARARSMTTMKTVHLFKVVQTGKEDSFIVNTHGIQKIGQVLIAKYKRGEEVA